MTSPVLAALKDIAHTVVSGGSMGSGELLARVRLAIRALEWQPLDTAPRDGSPVELRGESGYVGYPHRVMIAHYERSREDAPAIARGICTRDEMCWRTTGGDACTDDGPMPTHWRPAS